MFAIFSQKKKRDNKATEQKVSYMPLYYKIEIYLKHIMFTASFVWQYKI